MATTIKYKYLFEKTLAHLELEQVIALYHSLIKDYENFKVTDRRSELDKEALIPAIKLIERYLNSNCYRAEAVWDNEIYTPFKWKPKDKEDE